MKKRFLIPLLAAIALPTAVNADNQKDLIVETDLGEKIIIKESAIQVTRITKDSIISKINNSIEKRYEWYNKNCVGTSDKPRMCNDDPKKDEIKRTKLIQKYETEESEDLIFVRVIFTPIFEDLNGMKSRMTLSDAVCVNPRINVMSSDILYNYTGENLIDSKGVILGNNLPPMKYSGRAIDQVKTKLCEKYAKF